MKFKLRNFRCCPNCFGERSRNHFDIGTLLHTENLVSTTAHRKFSFHSEHSFLTPLLGQQSHKLTNTKHERLRFVENEQTSQQLGAWRTDDRAVVIFQSISDIWKMICSAQRQEKVMRVSINTYSRNLEFFWSLDPYDTAWKTGHFL